MVNDPPLKTLVTDQRRWSLTANALKASISQSRWLILILASIGAFLETLSSQVHESQPAIAVLAGYAGAAALAVIAVIKQYRLGRDRVQAWIMARAASESFKREMFLYRTKAGAYSEGNPEATLFDRRAQILAKTAAAQNYVVDPREQDLAVPAPLDADGYIKERVQAQIEWFRDRARSYSKTAEMFGTTELLLAIISALLGATLTFTAKYKFGSWVAVITTVSGTLGSHVAAQRYEQIRISYRAAADQLEGILGKWRAVKGTLSDLADQCEAALLAENQGWIAGTDDAMQAAPNQPPPGQGKPAAG